MTSLELGEYSPQALAALTAHAAGLRSLKVRGEHWFAVPAVRELDLRRLTTFACNAAYEILDYAWWNGFDSLRALRVAPLNFLTLPALAAAPWCDRLESMELGTLFGDSDGKSWYEFWHGRTVPWRSLRLEGLGWSLQTLLTEGSFPDLRRLQIHRVEFTKGALYAALSSANLPTLTDLEVQCEDLSEDELVEFLKSPRAGLPNLRQLYVTLPSGEVDGYLDGWFHIGPVKYLPYSPDEFEERFLKPYGLTALRIE